MMPMPKQIELEEITRKTAPMFNVNYPVLGSFMIIRGKREEIHFRDADGNYFEVRDFDFMIPHATEREGRYHYPRPYIYDPDGKMVRQGEIVVVIFRNGNSSMPICLGAVRPGNWTASGTFHGFKKDVYMRQAERWETPKSLTETYIDSDGDRSEQVCINDDIGDSLSFIERKKNLKKVITKSSTTSLDGTRLVHQVGLDDSRFPPPDDEKDMTKYARMVPDGDYFSIRHFSKEDGTGKPRGHFGMQLTNSGELLVDFDQLLEGAIEYAEKRVGKGNVKVRIMGSNPQGNRPGIDSDIKNGNINIEYNGDLLISNDAQSIDGSDNTARHTINQRIITNNNEDQELVKIAQSKVDEDGNYNKKAAGGIDERDGKDDLNSIVLDRNIKDKKQKIDIFSQELESLTNRVNKLALFSLDLTAENEKIEIRSENSSRDVDNRLLMKNSDKSISILNKQSGGDNKFIGNEAGWQLMDHVGNKILLETAGTGTLQLHHKDGANIKIEKDNITVTGSSVTVSGEAKITGLTTIGAGTYEGVRALPLSEILNTIVSTLTSHFHPGPTGPTSPAVQFATPPFSLLTNKINNIVASKIKLE